MLRYKLRQWLGIEALSQASRIQANTLGELNQNFIKLGQSVSEARITLAEMKVAQYVPPQQSEPQKKVVQAKNMREYNYLLDREQEEKESSNAA